MSAISQRLDHPGIYANTPDDIKLVASVILSYDAKDLDMDSNYIFKNQAISNPSPKFAFIKGPVWSSGDKDMQVAIEKFVANFPMEIEAIELGNDFKEAAKTHEIIMNGSISNSLSPYYNEDKSKLHPFTVNRICLLYTSDAADE